MAALARVALSMVALNLAYGCTSHGCTSYGCACQEEHFDLIFSLNDTTGAGHIKVAELAQFMESLGHGLPAHQLEEMIKDMGMDEDIDRTIFLDGFLPELSEAGRSWRSIFRPSFLELLEREGHSTRIIFRSTFLEFMRRTLVRC